MSYALNPDEPLPAGIHDARKRFGKVRAVLRLVRKELRSDRYQRENKAYRDAGRLLSDVRESSVLPSTVNALLDRHEHLLERDPFEAFVQRLESRHAETTPRRPRPSSSDWAPTVTVDRPRIWTRSCWGSEDPLGGADFEDPVGPHSGPSRTLSPSDVGPPVMEMRASDSFRCR